MVITTTIVIDYVVQECAPPRKWWRNSVILNDLKYFCQNIEIHVEFPYIVTFRELLMMGLPLMGLNFREMLS